MASTFYLEIISSDKLFFTGNAEMIIFPAIDGLHGVLPKHEPMVTSLATGELKIKVDGEWRYAAVSEGFVEIMPDYVILLADTVELPGEIDINRANEAKMRAEEKLRQKESLLEHYHAQMALSKAMARLKVTSKRM